MKKTIGVKVQPEAEIYCFRDGKLLALATDEVDGSLAAADSWLVDEGRVRGLDKHFGRFAAAVDWVSPEHSALLPEFFERVAQKMPRTGRWFPRIEIHDHEQSGNHLHLRLRVAPEPQTTIRLWTLDEPDPRTNPRVKGPDLSLGQQLRRRANLSGADEAVLLTAERFVAEGALSSIVWWRGDTLCAPGDQIPWLPSITRNLVLSIAEQSGHPISFESAKPEELGGLEIWALGSLHGIRVVSEWNELPLAPAKPTHADAFNRRLRLLSTALTGGS